MLKSDCANSDEGRWKYIVLSSISVLKVEPHHSSILVVQRLTAMFLPGSATICFTPWIERMSVLALTRSDYVFA